MTKNDWLMISYIFFLLISAIVRSFIDYPMWETLVIAVTISGGFLTYSESFESSYNFLRRGNEETKEWIEKFTATTNQEIETCEEIISSIQKSDVHTEFFTEITEDFKAISSELKNRFNSKEIEEKQKKQRNYEKIYNVVSIGLAIVGFLLFFCILVFPSVKKIFVDSQSIYTVLAFAVMLSSQYSRSYREKKISSDQKEINEKYQEYEKQRADLIKLKEKVIEGLKLEAKTNAD